LDPGRVPRHVKAYANLKETVVEAVTQFRDEVREGKFPGEEHAFS
jgi:3-methyl-2-oxobutanoate hydroxymethyltransferase